LMSIREKYEGLANLGINRLLVITFNDNLRNMQPIDFIKKVFVDGLRVKHIIVGDDFRFGKDGVGNFELLVSLGKKYNFTVENTATIEQKEQRVSSTRIRKFLENADFFSAKNMLGKSYSISGKVIYGDQLGREIGVPTANLELHRLRTALSGVYAVNVKIDNANEWLQGIANVGCRPTINDSIKAILEVHILNFDKNIYGKRITVRFLKKIRDEIKFESIEILKSQIFKDLDIVKIYFGD
jgi:riboflavin kinase/FMN adenylyltransferase